MKLLCKSLALVVVSAFAVVSVFGGGFQLNEQGARAMAQAGAFAARAYDGSAIYFNPAGLGFQTEGSVYLGATVILPRSSFYGPLEYNTNTKWEMKDQAFTPINATISYPIMEGFTAAVGVNNAFGLGTEWPEDWTGNVFSQKADLKSWFISPTVSYRLTDQLSVGAGLNYVYGTVTLKRAVDNALEPPTQVTLDLSGSGVGFNLGVLYKITPDLSAGVSYRGQTKVDATGSASFSRSLSVLPAGDAAASITLPATGFVGLAYKPIENCEIEADLQYIGWSSYKELKIDFKSNGTSNVSPKDYQDTYILRIGGEYTMESWHFRAGYLYDHSPVKVEYVDPILPDANRNGINVGLGYDFTPKISADVAYFLLKFDERKVENSVIGFDGTYHSYANLIGANLEFKF